MKIIHSHQRGNPGNVPIVLEAGARGISGAMGSAPMPSQPGRISYSVNGADYRGQAAVGGEFKYRLPTANPMAVGVGFSLSGHNNNGVRVGVAGEF